MWEAGGRSKDAHVGSKLGINSLYELPDTNFCDFFFINVEFILSVKKCKKVIFEKNKVQKFAKKTDSP